MNIKLDTQISSALANQLNDIKKLCNGCGTCVEECAFLKTYGNPLVIAEGYAPDNPKFHVIPFECSLCGLCTAECRRSAQPDALFLEMRNQSHAMDYASFPEHKRILAYERRGTSEKYSYYSLPQNCTAVFFPGCNIPGTRPDKIYRIFQLMKQKDDRIGIVLDCCTKPSHDIGNHEYFTAMFGEMKDYLVKNGVTEIITACPNCHKVFRTHGSPLKILSLYEYIESNLLDKLLPAKCAQTVAVHDPCSFRNQNRTHQSVRKILTHLHITQKDMPHSKNKSYCCGEGGSVSLLKPEFAETWAEKIRSEASGKTVITSCGGCANYINRKTRAAHILDIIFEPEKTLAGKAKVSSWPFTSINRIRLKRKLKKNYSDPTTRERDYSPLQDKQGSGILKLLLIAVIIAAIISARKSGLTSYLDQEKLRALLSSSPLLAPLVYIAIYIAGTVLFLPGLAISVVGGVLFGPFYGVIYTMLGATAGACLAFLVSRYAARGWVENKLRDPRLRSLDESVEKNGWKIVAFTRLIPLFPFNLLNYAFGLTKIKFSHYAIGSFVFMLPGCIAFIVFSSSLLDLINGKISKEFIIGLVLIIIVSALPMVWRKIKMKKSRLSDRD